MTCPQRLYVTLIMLSVLFLAREEDGLVQHEVVNPSLVVEFQVSERVNPVLLNLSRSS